ncbi:UNVERIFIED_ORG: hypothetical protein [Escherichia phage CMSTMSU]
MYASARQQIVEHNLSSSEYKIGKNIFLKVKSVHFLVKIVSILKMEFY